MPTKKTQSKHWKNVESRIARFFGGCRVPLSGGNSKHTRADVMRIPDLFIEIKHRAKMATWSLWEETKILATAENRTPVVCLHQKTKHGFLLCVHSDDLDTFIDYFNRKRRDEACNGLQPSLDNNGNGDSIQ